MAAALTALAAAAGDDPTASQPVDGPAFGTEVEVTVVNLDVFVRDRKGRPVGGLTAEDFRVTQDGIDVPISNFAVYTLEAVDRRSLSPEAPEVAAVNLGTTPPPVPPVYVVLHIDNANLLAGQRNRVLKRVGAFVEETMAAPAKMMVASSQSSLQIRQPFTDDPHAVIAALQRVSRESGGRIVRDRQRRRILAWLEESASNKGRTAMGRFFAINPQANKAQVQAQILAYTKEETDAQKTTLAAMHQVLRLVSGLEGRRSIVYVSSGLPLTPGLGLMYEFAAVFRDTSIFARQVQWTLTGDLLSLATAANRQGVSLYTIDASGLNHLEGFGADHDVVPEATASWASLQNQQASLAYLADATGGLALINTNDVSAGLRLIRDDFVNYYSIGYTASTGNEERKHSVRVELPHYPEYEIRHRKWFIEKPLEVRVRERVFGLLVGDIESNPMELQLRFGKPISAPGKRWEVPCQVSIPLRNLVLASEADDYVGHVELYLGARNVLGDESLPHHKEYEVRIPAAQYKPEQNQSCSIVMNLRLREQQNIIAVGIVDLATHHASYARAMVKVP